MSSQGQNQSQALAQSGDESHIYSVPFLAGSFPTLDLDMLFNTSTANAHLTSDLMPDSRQRPADRNDDLEHYVSDLPLNPMMIPAGSGQIKWEDHVSVQRWRQSPAQEEQTSLPISTNALASLQPGIDLITHSLSAQSRQNYDTASTSSADTSAWSDTPFSSSKRPTRLKRNKRYIIKGQGASLKRPQNNMRIFKCTFCSDSFRTKFDWARHEKTIHLNLEAWVCAPEGGLHSITAAGRGICVYCGAQDQTLDHLNIHKFTACHCRAWQARCFTRKDHLVQHLKTMHKISTVPFIENWKITRDDVPSRCGFCGEQLQTWSSRARHLTAHFRSGLTMESWNGDHGFPPDIAEQVRNALPPYLIAAETRSIVPFSASNLGGTNDHLDQIHRRARDARARNSNNNNVNHDNGAEEVGQGDNASSAMEPILQSRTASTRVFADVVTQHLQYFAQEKLALGINPTDEMLRQEARILIYECTDGWNTTIADNSEWLKNFRQVAGLWEMPYS